MLFLYCPIERKKSFLFVLFVLKQQQHFVYYLFGLSILAYLSNILLLMFHVFIVCFVQDFKTKQFLQNVD